MANTSKKSYLISSSFPTELLHNIEPYVIDVSILNPNLLQILQSKDLMKELNVVELTPTYFCNVALQHVLPKSWKGQTKVAWDSNIVSYDWLQQFWKYVGNVDLSVMKMWPLLPSQNVLLALEDRPKVLSSVLAQNLRESLRQLGVFQLEVEKFSLPLKNASFVKYTLPGNPVGNSNTNRSNINE